MAQGGPSKSFRGGQEAGRQAAGAVFRRLISQRPREVLAETGVDGHGGGSGEVAHVRVNPGGPEMHRKAVHPTKAPGQLQGDVSLTQHRKMEKCGQLVPSLSVALAKIREQAIQEGVRSGQREGTRRTCHLQLQPSEGLEQSSPLLWDKAIPLPEELWRLGQQQQRTASCVPMVPRALRLSKHCSLRC